MDTWQGETIHPRTHHHQQPARTATAIHAGGMFTLDDAASVDTSPARPLSSPRPAGPMLTGSFMPQRRALRIRGKAAAVRAGTTDAPSPGRRAGGPRRHKPTSNPSATGVQNEQAGGFFIAVAPCAG